MVRAGAYKVRLNNEARPIVEQAFASQCADAAQFDAMLKKLATTLKSFVNRGQLLPDSVVDSQSHPEFGQVHVAPLWGVQLAICVDEIHLEIHIVGAA